MQQALRETEHGLRVEFASPEDAIKCRWVCYNIRSAFRLAGDNHFDELSFSVSDKALLIRKSSSAKIESLTEIKP